MTAMTDTAPILEIRDLTKTFVLHTRGGASIPVLDRFSLSVDAGECVALNGPSGVGKSTVLRLIYGNYRAGGGEIRVRHAGRMVAVTDAEPRRLIDLRRHAVAYVSQFLRVIPRVPALDIVAAPLIALGCDALEAQARAGALLARLNLPERLWTLPPATFSGGEQQRVNVAVGLIAPRPLLLLDEPTASLDAGNRAVVIDLVREAVAGGAAVLGIFHDPMVREAIADRAVALSARDRQEPDQQAGEP